MVGNIPNFTKIDILRCFLRFHKNIGRQELARSLNLGEGTIRSILEALKSKGLLDSTKRGHFLSKKGSEMLAGLGASVSTPKNISANSIYPGLKKAAIVIKDAKRLGEPYMLRDIAVRNGADGAIILKFKDSLYAPGSDYIQDYKELEGSFELKENDVLVVAFSGSNSKSEAGALAIALELSPELKKFMEAF